MYTVDVHINNVIIKASYLQNNEIYIENMQSTFFCKYYTLHSTMKKGNSMLAIVIVIAIAVILFFVYKSSRGTKPAEVTPETPAPVVQPAPAPEPLPATAPDAQAPAPAAETPKADTPAPGAVKK